MIRRTGLAPWEFESPFPGSLTSTFLHQVRGAQHADGVRLHAQLLEEPGGHVLGEARPVPLVTPELNLRTTSWQKCEAVPRRARI